MDSTKGTGTRRGSTAAGGGSSPKKNKAKGLKAENLTAGIAGAKVEDPGPARERILDAAEAVFAEKGVDGARVEEIARAAGVNKALIYYYFEGKAQLLNAVMERVLEENVSVKERAVESGADEQELIPALMSARFEFLKKRKDFFRILFTELFQGDRQSMDVFPYLERTFESGRALRESLGLGDVDPSVWRLPEVFFGMAPMLFFLLLEEKWASYYKANREELEKEFMGQFTEFYVTFARKLLPQMMGSNRKERDYPAFPDIRSP